MLERDGLGRVVADICNGRRLTRTYDLAGRITARRTPSGVGSSYRYDPVGRRIAVESAGRSMAFGYDEAGRETVRHAGATALEQTWDTVNRLIGQTVMVASHPNAVPGTASAPASGRHLLQRRAYVYRADGHPTGTDDHLHGARTFTLDAAGRVLSVDARNWSERYAYDNTGNLTEAHWPTSGSGTDVSGGSREYTGSRLQRAGAVHYAYDRQGRVVMRRQVRLSRKPAVWHYTWDAEDRLTQVTTPDGRRYRYAYDPLGRRMAKRLVGDDGTVLAESTFAWDGSLLVEERAMDPASSRSIVLTWEYKGFEPVSQAERILADDMSQHEVDSRFFAIITDLTGCPRELVGEDGTLAWQGRSSLWGDTSWAADSAAYTPLRFPGQYFDRETGLHYNVNRYYDPATARYTSPDPLGLSPAPNPEAYVPNPHVASDPLGLSPYPKKFDLSGATQVSGRFPKNANPGEVLYRAKEDGSVTAYAVYDEDGVIARRVDVDPDSAPHGGVPAPHVLEMRKHVNPKTGQVFYNWEKMPRPARPDELP